MQYALLGADDDSLRVADYLASQGWRCAAACETPTKYRPWTRRLAPGAREGETWESLVALSATMPLLVIVAGDLPSEPRTEQLRKLAQAGAPMLVVHPASEAIVALELEMIRNDTRAPLIAWSPGQWHPAWQSLHAAIGEQTAGEGIGVVQQLSLERGMAVASPAELRRQLARDVLLLEPFLGEVEQVSAVGHRPAEPTAPMTQFTATFAGEGDIHARWSQAMLPGHDARLELIGSKGRVVLHMAAGEGAWRLQLPGRPEQVYAASFALTEGPVLLAQIDVGFRGERIHPEWSDACRSLEVAECAFESLERGKTIQLHHEPPSEQKTFKGMMAIGGCGLLLAMVGLLVFAALADGLGFRLNRFPAWGALTAGFFALLVGFLVLQAVVHLLQARPGEPRS